jgi:hypothetical protein
VHRRSEMAGVGVLGVGGRDGVSCADGCIGSHVHTWGWQYAGDVCAAVNSEDLGTDGIGK